MQNDKTQATAAGTHASITRTTDVGVRVTSKRYPQPTR